VFGYDPGHTGYVDALVQPRKLSGSLAWSRKFAPIFSSAVAGLGMVYIASTDGYLYALSQASGTITWRAAVGNYLTDSTPALEGQTLFVAARGTTIEALNAQTGAVYWTFAVAERIEAPPLVVGSRVLVASRTTLWTLNATDGSLLWKFHRGAVGWPTTGVPAVAGDTVYVGLGSGSSLWALNLTNGQIVWAFDTGIATGSLVIGVLAEHLGHQLGAFHHIHGLRQRPRQGDDPLRQALRSHKLRRMPPVPVRCLLIGVRDGEQRSFLIQAPEEGERHRRSAGAGDHA